MVVELAGTTCTVVPLLQDPPDVAVTVIVRVVELAAVESVAVAEPVVSVVAHPLLPFVTTRPPELALKQTCTPAIKLLSLFRARAVMVAVAEPSDGIVVTLLFKLREDADAVPLELAYTSRQLNSLRFLLRL